MGMVQVLSVSLVALVFLNVLNTIILQQQRRARPLQQSLLQRQLQRLLQHHRRFILRLRY